MRTRFLWAWSSPVTYGLVLLCPVNFRKPAISIGSRVPCNSRLVRACRSNKNHDSRDQRKEKVKKYKKKEKGKKGKKNIIAKSSMAEAAPTPERERKGPWANRVLSTDIDKTPEYDAFIEKLSEYHQKRRLVVLERKGCAVVADTRARPNFAGQHLLLSQSSGGNCSTFESCTRR